MSTAIELSIGSEQDLPDVIRAISAVALETEGLALDFDAVSRGALRLLHSGDLGFYLIAREKHNSRLIGMLGITFEWSDWKGEMYWWLQSVYVVPKSRREGVFKSMIAYLKFLATDTTLSYSVQSIRLYHVVDNMIAQTVYEKIGFKKSDYEMMQWDLEKL